MRPGTLAVAVLALAVGGVLLGLAVAVDSVGLGAAAFLVLAVGASMFGKGGRSGGEQ